MLHCDVNVCLLKENAPTIEHQITSAAGKFYTGVGEHKK